MFKFFLELKLWIKQRQESLKEAKLRFENDKPAVGSFRLQRCGAYTGSWAKGMCGMFFMTKSSF